MSNKDIHARIRPESSLNIVWKGIILALLGLSACQPVQPLAPTSNPPQPQVHMIENTSTPETHLPQPTVRLTETVLVQSIPELSATVYGDRLIQWIRIPMLDIYAPVTPVGWSPDPDDTQNSVWDSPGAQAGWVFNSALPDEGRGNVILYGHNNIESSIFLHLGNIIQGDMILLTTGQREWTYQVNQVNILPVLDPEADALAYAEYFKPTSAPRLTIVSCWPPDNNTHRVIVIAYPAYNLP